MNTPTKKLILIITTLLACMAFMASCSKQQPAAKPEKKSKKAVAETKTQGGIPSDARNTLSAVRNGPNVTLNWRIGAPGGKIDQINISRNTTGTDKQRKRVVELSPGTTSYADTLPDENAYWYWVRLRLEDGKYQEIGPARVEADKAGPAGYGRQNDKYKTSVTRTDDFVTVKWDFPEDEYKQIKITRSLRPVGGATGGAKKGNNVVSTKERKSQFTKPLPDPNADYWYWFQITLQSGAIINKGPIKAEYAKR